MKDRPKNLCDLVLRPEFIAFCEMMGIPWELNSEGICIDISLEEIKIHHRYQTTEPEVRQGRLKERRI